MVGLVLVSHSAALAAGLAELAGQMAPEVPIRAAGGRDDGAIGTSLEKVSAALAEADRGDGVVVLFDLGSAQMIAEVALELLDDAARERVRILDAPLVEGALAAATTAAGGASLEAVVAAVPQRSAGGERRAPDAAPGPQATDSADSEEVRVVTLVNPLGLHARAAVQVVRLAAELDVEVRIAPVTGGASAPASSLLGLVALGTRAGTTLRVSAAGLGAAGAVERVAALLASGLGETGPGDAGSTV